MNHYDFYDVQPNFASITICSINAENKQCFLDEVKRMNTSWEHYVAQVGETPNSKIGQWKFCAFEEIFSYELNSFKIRSKRGDKLDLDEI